MRPNPFPVLTRSYSFPRTGTTTPTRTRSPVPPLKGTGTGTGSVRHQERGQIALPVPAYLIGFAARTDASGRIRSSPSDRSTMQETQTHETQTNREGVGALQSLAPPPWTPTPEVGSQYVRIFWNPPKSQKPPEYQRKRRKSDMNTQHKNAPKRGNTSEHH